MRAVLLGLVLFVGLAGSAHAMTECDVAAEAAWKSAHHRNLGWSMARELAEMRKYVRYEPARVMFTEMLEWIWSHPNVTPGEVAAIARGACGWPMPDKRQGAPG